MSRQPLPIYYYDHHFLRTKCRPVEEFNDELRQFVEDLTFGMIHYHGVGLAAPQVGKLIRVIVIRDEWIGPDGKYHLGHPEVLINPVLSKPYPETETMPEGCISLPGLHVEVERPKGIHVRYQTVEGKFVEENVPGFRSRVIMHENDHLNGVLHIDRASPAIRKQIEPVLRAIKKKYNP